MPARSCNDGSATGQRVTYRFLSIQRISRSQRIVSAYKVALTTPVPVRSPSTTPCTGPCAPPGPSASPLVRAGPAVRVAVAASLNVTDSGFDADAPLEHAERTRAAESGAARRTVRVRDDIRAFSRGYFSARPRDTSRLAFWGDSLAQQIHSAVPARARRGARRLYVARGLQQRREQRRRHPADRATGQGRHERVEQARRRKDPRGRKETRKGLARRVQEVQRDAPRGLYQRPHQDRWALSRRGRHLRHAH